MESRHALDRPPAPHRWWCSRRDSWPARAWGHKTASGALPFRGWSLTRVRAAVHYRAYEFQARPDLVHCTDLYIYQALRQPKLPHDVLRKVGVRSSCTLRPRDPEYSFIRERSRETRESARQIHPAARKLMNEVGGSGEFRLNGRSRGQWSEQGLIGGRRTQGYHPGVRLDSQLLRQAAARVAGNHTLIMSPGRRDRVPFPGQLPAMSSPQYHDGLRRSFRA